ncbi:lactoylglutathione lyase [Cupriavidus necator N-1]|uniref:Lactoylglutathione lyase n=1 Tax=Cupriavidus necator (strain ATCC 43291 / DSM 13513 / CCUG 52238 / LMG 8453 / N-1) TaxID=1042878 RepID=F8GQZ8_CUPNN|nr:lactoylglutathione lyase [Cupriavidus necator N-1]
MSLIDHLDHLVLTCVDLEATRHFYTEVMQMQPETFGNGRLAFRFGNQKINLHQRGAEFEPKAHLPVPGYSISALSLRSRSTASSPIFSDASGPLSKDLWRAPAPRRRSARSTCAIRT